MGSYSVLRALLADRFRGGRTMVALATQAAAGGGTAITLNPGLIIFISLVIFH
jgi:hypothetical protein